MIFTERNITIRNDSATINAPVILYRGDKNVEVRFILIESPYKYSNRDSINIFESTDASYAQLVIKTPNDREPIFGDITAVGNNNVTFVIRHDMIDEIEEVGKYDFQIRLFDADQTSMATTPEVVGGFIIKEPIAKEDSNNNITNSAIVGSAVVTNDLEIPTFVDSGYNKTAWHDGDVISKQKLNKMEVGIYETYELSKDNSSQIKEIVNNQIPEEYLQQNIDDYISNNNGGLTTKTEFNTLVESGLDSIISKNEIKKYTEPFKTSINISEFTNALATPSQAYGNGYISTTNEQLTEIIFHEGTTSTKICIYVFNSSNTLISQQENLDVSNLKCILTTPIELSIGDYVLIRCLDGESRYKRLSENTAKEYQPGGGNLIDSPIVLAFDIKTKQLKDVIEYKFKPMDNSSLNINDFIVPKVVRLKDEGYTLLGRWFKKDSTFSECCNSAGASIMFKVKDATSVSININQIIHPSHPEYVMSDEPYFAYSIDGGDFVRVQIGSEEKNINIPSTDEHLVWIVVDGMCLNSGNANRNSGWSGVYIKSLTTDGKMYKVAIKNKQILFVGDSIVEGINTLGTDSTSSSNSCVNEFSFKTARKLNAIPLIQGYGGSTSWDGVDYTRYSLVDYKLDTFINIQEPDLILIEYGYNDNSVISVGGKTKEYFIEQYTLLINILKGKYSGVPIICMIPFKQSLREEIINIANLYDDCYVIETGSYEITYSDSAHPNVEGAENASTELSKDILKIFGKQFFI